MSNKITVPLVKYNYALVGIALQLCPQRTKLTPMDRLVLIDILQRLPFSSEGQVIDLDKCADWQIHRSQIARAVGISLLTVSRSIAKIEELGLLNVIRSKTAEGKNKANRFVPMIDKFIEYAVAEDEASVEAAEAVARALDSATKCHQSRSEDTDVPLTTAPTAVTASTATKTNKPNKTESTVVLPDEAGAEDGNRYEDSRHRNELRYEVSGDEDGVRREDGGICHQSSSSGNSIAPSPDEIWQRLNSR